MITAIASEQQQQQLGDIKWFFLDITHTCTAMTLKKKRQVTKREILTRDLPIYLHSHTDLRMQGGMTLTEAESLPPARAEQAVFALLYSCV